VCKHSRKIFVDTSGRVTAILAGVGVKNAWEIKLYQPTISSRIPRQTGGFTVTSTSKVPITACYSVPIAMLIVPGGGGKRRRNLLRSGKEK
jgi:hypothetical protein